MYHFFVFIIDKIKRFNKTPFFNQCRHLLNQAGWREFGDALDEYKNDLYIETMNNFYNYKNEDYVDIAFHTINNHSHWIYGYITEKNQNNLTIINSILQDLVTNNCRLQDLFPMIDFTDEEHITELLYNIKFKELLDINCVYTKLTILKQYKKEFPNQYHRYMLAYSQRYRSANIIQRNYRYARYRPSENRLAYNIVLKNLELENIILKS